MNTATLHGQLHVSYPDGFHVMGEEELHQAFADNNPNRWGIWDTDRHIIVAILWHESNALLSRLADTKGLAKRVQKHTAKTYAHYGYKAGELTRGETCGSEAWGFDYRFDMDGVGQVGRTEVFKHVEDGTCLCYTLYCYAREKQAQDGKEAFEAILASLSIA